MPIGHLLCLNDVQVMLTDIDLMSNLTLTDHTPSDFINNKSILIRHKIVDCKKKIH